MYFGQNPNRMANMNERQWNDGGAARPFFRQNRRLGHDVIRQDIQERQNNRPGARQNQRNAPHQTQQAQQWNRQAGAQQQLPQAQQPYTDPSVTWEPITENTFAGIAKSMSAGAGTPPSQPAFQSPSSDKLKAVIQNEKNAATYYAKLAERHVSQPFAAGLKGRSEKNIQSLQELYRMRGGGEAQLTEIELDAPGSYIGALRFALGEENKALVELSELCESEFADNPRVTALLLRKLCLISSLVNEIFGLTNNI